MCGSRMKTKKSRPLDFTFHKIFSKTIFKNFFTKSLKECVEENQKYIYIFRPLSVKQTSPSKDHGKGV